MKRDGKTSTGVTPHGRSNSLYFHLRTDRRLWLEHTNRSFGHVHHCARRYSTPSVVGTDADEFFPSSGTESPSRTAGLIVPSKIRPAHQQDAFRRQLSDEDSFVEQHLLEDER